MEKSSNRQVLASRASLAVAWLLVAQLASAQSSAPDSNRWSVSLIPFAYYSELFKSSAGVLLRASRPCPPGSPGDSRLADFVVFGSQNGSWYLYHRFQGLASPLGLGFEPTVLAGRFGEIRGYTDHEPRSFPDRSGEQFPGHNQSSPDDFLTASGRDLWLRGRLSWTPAWPTTSDLHLSVEPFYRDQADQVTAGATISLTHDHRDDPTDPNRGNRQEVAWQRDPGGGPLRPPWIVWTFEHCCYCSMGSAGTVGAACWARVSPSFDDTHMEVQADGSHVRVQHQPPAFAAPALGSDSRLRAYPENRFNDQAAWLYQVEWRKRLPWNPVRSWDVRWLQSVVFVEAGRVASRWDVALFHQNMKHSAGVGLRAMYRNVLLRVDLAAGQEGLQVQMFVDHAF